MAAANGASFVTIVEPAPELVRLVREDLSGFSGGWPSVPVEITVEGWRNFLARDRRTFDIIEAADISSPTFSSVGVHATGEAFLLTREGVRAALARERRVVFHRHVEQRRFGIRKRRKRKAAFPAGPAHHR